MGYSHSVATIQRRQSLLAPLLLGGAVITWHPTQDEDLHSIAYHLRECRYIARKKRGELGTLAALFDRYEIKVNHNRGVVEAIRKPEALDQFRVDVATLITKEELEKPKIILYASNSSQVIQDWLDHQPSQAPLVFQEAMLVEEDLGEVIRWAGSMVPPWEVVMEGQRLTLRLENGHGPE